MRIDKFLKVSRLIKRRTLAKTMADHGRIQINDKVVKASANVQVGDQLTLQFGTKIVKIEVLQIQDSTKKDDAKYMFKYLESFNEVNHE